MTIDGERASPQEEDKAKMLFGSRHAVSFHSIPNFLGGESAHYPDLFNYCFWSKLFRMGDACAFCVKNINQITKTRRFKRISYLKT